MISAIVCKVYTTHTTTVRGTQLLGYSLGIIGINHFEQHKLTMAIRYVVITQIPIYCTLAYNYIFIYASMQKGHMYIFLVPYTYLSCCSGLIILVGLSNNILLYYCAHSKQ